MSSVGETVDKVYSDAPVFIHSFPHSQLKLSFRADLSAFVTGQIQIYATDLDHHCDHTKSIHQFALKLFSVFTVMNNTKIIFLVCFSLSLRL